MRAVYMVSRIIEPHIVSKIIINELVDTEMILLLRCTMHIEHFCPRTAKRSNSKKQLSKLGKNCMLLSYT